MMIGFFNVTLDPATDPNSLVREPTPKAGD
jgi:hypothetical protein